MRIMWSDMQGFLERLTELRPGLQNDSSLLAEVLGVGRYIHLYREDRIAQAVSLVLAKQTGLWHKNADGTIREQTGEPEQAVYSHDQIAAELAMLEQEAKGWGSWFADNQISPLQLSYESLVAEPSTSLHTILDHLDLPSTTNATVSMQKLAGELNQEWARRFRLRR